MTISYLTYLETFSYGKMGGGAALSFLISIFTIIMALFYIRFLYRRRGDPVVHPHTFRRNLLLFLVTLLASSLFLPDPVAVQRQSLDADRTLYGAAALDPPASDLSELPGYRLPGQAAASVPRTMAVTL